MFNNTEFETVVENNYCTHNPLKGVLNGFLIQVREIINAPNTLRKATKYISALIIKNFSQNFRIFSKYFFGKKYINLNFYEKFLKYVEVRSTFSLQFCSSFNLRVLSVQSDENNFLETPKIDFRLN
jgi:hypothetical protein